MIVLDTNVLSALMRPEGNPAVVAWLDNQPPESVWITAITVFEIRFGLEILADGRRRRRLEQEFTDLVDQDLGGRVLSFDRAAADATASIGAQRRRVGRPVEVRDVQIAGIVAARKATLATRNSRHFEGLGITLINPWHG